MADAVLFFGWNRSVSGREAEAGALFQDALAMYTTFQKEGKIESFEPVILAAHGGDLNGFVLIRGDAKKLNDLRLDDRFLDLQIRSNLLLNGSGVLSGYIGPGLQKIMTRWQALTAK